MTQEELIFQLEPIADNLLSFCSHLTQDDQDGHDLCQDTIERALMNLDKFQVGTNFKAWIFTIARNNFINNLRSKKRRGYTTDIDDAIGISNPTGGLGSVGDINFEDFSNLLSDDLYMALSALTDESRLLILLAYVYDFQYDEIAIVMDIPIGTVRSKIFRAKKILHESLKGKYKKKKTIN
jgi:RNA polymerase sigma factor (sigma-70 family)